MKKKKHELKKEFEQRVGILEDSLTDEQMLRIKEILSEFPANERTLSNVQEVVKSVSGISSFYVREALDNSDIDNLIGQLKDIIDNEDDEQE